MALTWPGKPKGVHGSYQPASTRKQPLIDCVERKTMSRNVKRIQPLVLLRLAKSLAVP